MENLAQLIEQERTRLTEEKQKLETRLQEINRELEAVTAYERAKTGKTTTPTTGTRRSGIRNDVFTVIAASTEGMNRRQLLEHFNAVGDKKLEQSISNALSALKKSGQISQNEAGLYHGTETTGTRRKEPGGRRRTQTLRSE